MSKTLYYDSNTHLLVIGDFASNELDPITIEPTLSADTFKLSEDGKLQIKINGEYVSVGDKSLVGPAPLLKIENGCLYALYDNDEDWSPLGQIVSDDITAEFASHAYVRALPWEHQYPELYTTNNTIIGAINELASFHYLPDNYPTTYSDGTALIAFTNLDFEVESSSLMYKLTGVVKSSIDNGKTNACLVAIPKDRNYADPSTWKDVNYEYYRDIIVVSFNDMFELPEGKSINDYSLYVCFVAPSVIGNMIPNCFGDNSSWEILKYSSFTEYPVTIMVSNIQLLPVLPVEPVTTEYLMPEIQDQVNNLSEKVTQLENELNLANDTISTLLTKIEWLDQLNQEEMLLYWGLKTTTEE